MEEEKIVKVERRLVGRVPYEYKIDSTTTVLEADSGFGKVGAKLDPSTGAMKYNKFEDNVLEERIPKPAPEPKSLRFSKDSKAMIHFKEDEETKISERGELKDHSVSGVVSVLNLSEKDRIWDVGVKLQEITGMAKLDFQDINATEIEPRHKVSKEYDIALQRPSIMIEEIISTHPQFRESLILQKDKSNHVNLQLGLKNLSRNPYKSVIIKKPVTPKLKNVIFLGEGAEDVSIEDGELEWKINNLAVDGLKTLTYEGDIESETSENIPIGEIILEGRGEDTVSEFVITDFDAMCKNMYFIEADETDEPGKWICRFVCENTSSFEFEILKVEVKDPTTGQVYLNLGKPGVKVPPNEHWISKSWIVFGQERPSFIKNLVLNVIPGLTKEINYKLNKAGGEFQVAGLEFKKSFDKSLVRARRVSDIEARIELENVGSAPLEQIFIRDQIPKYMLPPAKSAVKVERGSKVLDDNVGVIVEPQDEGGAVDQKLFIHIHDLSQFAGPLENGEKIVVTYTTKAFNPEPNSKIIAPVEADGKPYLPGPVVMGKDIAGAPVLGTKQIIRKFSIGKSIEQGKERGEYHIALLYKNRGNLPIKDLVIKDIIPPNFSGGGYSEDPETESTPDGITKLHWGIPSVKEGETIGISYTIKGEGEYHPRDAQIFYNTGGLSAELSTKEEIKVEEPEQETTAEIQELESALKRDEEESTQTEPESEEATTEPEAEAEEGSEWKVEDDEQTAEEETKEKEYDNKPLDEFKD